MSSATIRLKVEDSDTLGRGVGYTETDRFTIPGVIAGETVDICPTERHGRPWGQVVQVLEPSTSRAVDDCQYLYDCPGCTVRQLQPQWQLELQRKRIARALGAMPRHRHSDPSKLDIQCIGAAPRDGYRTRAIARALVNHHGALELGIVGYQRTVPLDSCPVQTQRVRTILRQVTQDLRTLGWRHYDTLTRQGQVRHVVVDAYDPMPHSIHRSARCVICLGKPSDRPITSADFPSVDQDVSLALDVLPYRRPGTFKDPVALRGSLSIHYQVGDDLIRSTVPAWCPQSPMTVVRLRDVIMEWLDVGAADTVLEVGCGTGVHTIEMLRRGARVAGLDYCRAAIDDARENTKRAGFDNVQLRVCEASKGLYRFGQLAGSVTKAVCHGMRVPFGPRAMAQLAALAPQRIVLVGPSMNSVSTDAQQLQSYRVQRVGFIDQTPGTAQALTVLQLDRV